MDISFYLLIHVMSLLLILCTIVENVGGGSVPLGALQSREQLMILLNFIT